MTDRPARRIGFVSTRLQGTDGVSLEAAKWATILERAGHVCHYFAGELDRPTERSRTALEASLRHPDIVAINGEVFAPGPWVVDQLDHPDRLWRRDFFSPYVRRPAVSRRIDELAEHLRGELERFCRDFDLELLIVENALSIPINLPLGVAISRFVLGAGIPVIAHHHDLPWERQRFALNTVEDVIAAAFPPRLPSVRHVVINSVQSQQLAWRTGLASVVIPNVMEFESPPPLPDAYGRRARHDIGVPEDRVLILQPTRIVQRKGIEHAIELTRRLGLPATLVISHAAGDEGTAYERRVHEFAHLLEVDVRFEAELVGPERATLPDGRSVYALADIYPHADLVTYPSSIEGFGNGFLEAVYHGRPIVVNRYSIYEIDIAPRGFRAVEFDSFISTETIEAAQRLLDDPRLVAEWAEINYRQGLRHFSFGVLERRLRALLDECMGATP